MELVLTDGTVLDELARENKTLWQKIKDRIFEIIEKIKKAYNDLSKTSRTAQILSETMDSLDDIEQLFYEGVTEAGERTRTAGVENTPEGNVEVIYSVSPNLGNELDLVLSGKFKADKNEVYLGETSNFLTDVIGAKALAHYMSASKAYSAMVTREEYDANPYYREQENYHGLGKEDFMEILEKSETPIIAFAAAPDEEGNKRQNRIVLVTDKKVVDVETGNLEYAVVVEEVDSIARKDNKKFKANKAITVFPRSKLNEDIQKAIIDHRLLDITKKGEHLFAGRRGSNPQAAIRKDALKENIAYFWANVKWESEKNNKKSTQEAETPSAIRAALEKAGYIDQNGQIKYMQESDESTEKNIFSIDETPETPDLSENATDTNDGRTEEELTDRDMLLAMAERLVGNEKENEILTRYKEQHEAQLRREDKLDSIYDEVDEQRGILFTDPDAAKKSAAFTTNLLRRRTIGCGYCEKSKKYFRFRKIISQNLLTNPPPWCIMMPMKCMAASERGKTAERRIELWQPRSKDPKPRWYLPRLTARKSRRR